MNQQVRKWGNSLAVRIPASISAALDWTENDQVEMLAQDGKLVIAKANRRDQLNELIAQITPENRHEPINWGEPVGKEIW